MKAKRVFIIVLDSFGIGEEPDAALFHDEGSNTLRSIVKSKEYNTPNLKDMGLFSIDGVDCLESVSHSKASYARMQETSMGKDTTIGHWEISGIISKTPMPTYPNGFPQEIINKIEEVTGRGILCNKPYSGTEVIKAFGKEQVETGKLIVYTSADSVLQIAAHEDVVPLEELYEDCRKVRSIMQGEHGVGRIIARPFNGTYPDYKRTTNRHDFSLVPPAPTMLDCLKEQGLETRAVGKIYDIFAGKSISKTISIKGNEDGMRKTMAWQKEDFTGLCFVNLVDFDMLYGHRNDVDGYAKAATVFDGQLSEFLSNMRQDDVLIITADHGCDPGTPSTDHSREYVPMLIYGACIKENINLGTRKTFADIAATVLDIFDVDDSKIKGESFLEKVYDPNKQLVEAACEVRKRAYAPYSEFFVGAALRGKSGKIYQGCNIENVSYPAGICAERSALATAISAGEQEFTQIAIVGGKKEDTKLEECPPCGICRQMLSEFDKDGSMEVVLAKNTREFRSVKLRELLPMGFSSI